MHNSPRGSGEGDARFTVGWFKSRSTRSIHVAVSGYGGTFCTCRGFAAHGRCWHVDAVGVGGRLVGVVGMEGVRIDDFVVRIKRYKSSVDALNRLFDGYAYSTSEVFALYGEPNVGKTLLAVQEMFWMASQGLNVLFVDTEGSLATALSYWKARFEQRFGKRTGEMYAVVYTTLEDLMRFLGYQVDVQLKGGKVEVSAEMLKGTPDVERFCEEKRIGFLILDSVSAPIRNRFPSAQQNFPARADVTGMVYATLLKLMGKGVSVLTTHHATFNPANPYETHAELRGGIVVQYFSKRIVYMDRREKRGMEDIRRFFLVRSPSAREWGAVSFGRIVPDRGLVDEEYRDEYLTDAERKMIQTGVLEELVEERAEPAPAPQQRRKRQ